ncbi:hypothetical protein [Roseateles sp.]|jgi:hypothetical protein|uniref:hypothetical protein n=1 Tax=Roseateles sp. TaxID=1971397 RepID=UPI0037C89494
MNPKSQHLQRRPLYGEPPAVAMPPCPACNGMLYRIPRRARDRMSSLFRPVRRYACQATGCGWVGNLSVSAAVRRHPGASGGRIYRL